MKTLLITRDLNEDSPIKQIASQDLKIIGKSFISFTEVRFDDWNRDADWVFFYSKNGVKHSLANAEFYDFCKTVSVGVYGQMTADYIQEYYKVTPDFIGDGSRLSTLDNYLRLEPHHTLFVQGDRSLKALQSDPKLVSAYSEVIAYRSLEHQHQPGDFSSPPDIIVFTSPLNVEYYLNQYDLRPTQTLWVIGETTGSALRQMTSHPFNIASRPSESVIAEEIARSLHRGY